MTPSAWRPCRRRPLADHQRGAARRRRCRRRCRRVPRGRCRRGRAPIRRPNRRRPCATDGRSSRSTPDIRVVAVNSTQCAPVELAGGAGPQAVGLLGVHDDRAALGGLVGEAGQLRGVGQLLRRHAGHRNELRRLPIAQRDGAGLVQQQRVDVACGLDRATRHGQHVALHQPVHAGDADRREQRADGRRDQADQQRHHHDAGDAAAVERQGVGHAGVVGLGVDRQRLQGGHREDEDDGQRGQQDVQRDLVRRLLPVGALDEGDHPVDEALAGLLGDPHDDAVGEHGGAAGHRGAVAAGLPDHRCGFAGDRRLIHRGNAFHDVAVARDDLPGLDDHDVALLQRGRGDLLLGRTRSPVEAAGRRCRTWPCAGCRPGPCRGPRRPPRRDWRRAPSATARTRSARRTSVGVDDGQDRRPDGADLDDEHHRVAPQGARIELAQRVRQRRPPASSGRAGRPADWPPSTSWSATRDVSRKSRGGLVQSCQWIPSASGPSASAGRKVSATRISVTPATIPTNCGRWVGRVPMDAGVVPCRGQRSGQRQHQDHRQEPAEQHRQRRGRCCTRRC